MYFSKKVEITESMFLSSLSGQNLSTTFLRFLILLHKSGLLNTLYVSVLVKGRICSFYTNIKYTVFIFIFPSPPLLDTVKLCTGVSCSITSTIPLFATVLVQHPGKRDFSGAADVMWRWEGGNSTHE